MSKINVFIYWDKGEKHMPPMIKTIYEHNKLMCSKFNLQLHLLSDGNIKNYITPHPSFEKLASNFKSDIIRYYILHKYGGFWFDTDVIIIKDITQIYNNMIINNKDIVLDEENDNMLGCATICMRQNSICSVYCYNYVNDWLNSNKKLKWIEIGPGTVNKLKENHLEKMTINVYNSIVNGCNIISWVNDPGINKDKWFLKSEIEAEYVANTLLNNPDCYYIITWTIYRKNNIDNLLDVVFKNRKSILSYFIDNSVVTDKHSILHHTYNTINTYNRKFGVVWAKTNNINDTINTLAAIEFLKNKGITSYEFLERESLDSYNGEPINVIMAGWFAHNQKLFPLPDNIHPIFIGFIIRNKELIKTNISYFKKYEPIGCYDLETVTILNSFNITAFYSGSLLFAFNPASHNSIVDKTTHKYLVDVNSKYKHIPNVHIDTKLFLDFIKITYELDSNVDLADRLIISKILLHKYSYANLVVTSNIDCAILCRSLNTPCTFIHNDYSTSSFYNGFHNLVNGSNVYHKNSGPLQNYSILAVKKYLNNIKII
jgi:hypothetical protein